MSRHGCAGRRALFAALMVGVAAGSAAAQVKRQDGTPVAPASKPDSKTVPQANPVLPNTAIPGLDDGDRRVRQAPMRVEGTFLAEKRGSMLKLPTGEWVFVFHKDEDGRRERPMVLAPCQTLQRMEQVATERGPETVMYVTGQVLAYVNVNYLLPTMYRVAAPDVKKTEGETKPETRPEAATPRPAAVMNDAALEGLIKDLEAQRSRPRGGEGAATPAAAPRGEPARANETAEGRDAGGLIPEGQSIVRRRGRMVRAADGQWTLRFDAGLAGDRAIDGPLTIVPGLNLQRMEAWAGRSGDQMTFEVSGRVLAYAGKNYLLPTMFQVYWPNDVEPRQ